MSTPAATVNVNEWRQSNDAYLGIALQWLRAVLAAAAPDAIADVPSTIAARQRMLDAEQVTPPPALAMLAGAVGLTRFEHDVVLLCAAMEMDTRIAGLCAAAHDDRLRPYPTFALAMAVFDDPEWSAVTPTGALRSWGLVEPEQQSIEPMMMRPLRLDERVMNFIKGLNVLDQRLAALVRPFEAHVEALPPSQELLVESINAAAANLPGSVVQLVGTNRASKRSVAARAAGVVGLQLLELTAASLPASVEDANDLARLWRRESRLLPVCLLIAADDESLTPTQTAAVRRLAGSGDGAIFVSLAEVCSDLADVSSVHDVKTPTHSEQRELWCAALGDDHFEVAIRLAAEFDLDGSEIAWVAGSASSERNRRRCGHDDLADIAHAIARGLCRPHLDALAQRRTPSATWDDIVLGAEPMRLLRSIADQARHRGVVYDEWEWRRRSDRGLGITALFTGESGTGKTMAAEVLANDLGLDLYRIDLSGVVSKYIGETEKNLRRLFDAAEHGGVLLFFDEADALFGKRSEVRDSHDRYANIEVNYLLQRMESFQGVAILATNMRSALDTAFIRRLRFIVPFALPGQAERELIWAAAFPDKVPTEGLDARRLARLNVTGAVIHSIAMHAAFAAASAGSAVTMDLVLGAARTELRKAERPTNEVESV